MKTRYSHLTLNDLRQIERWRLMKMSATPIPRPLRRTRKCLGYRSHAEVFRANISGASQDRQMPD
jgi:IS30 family transposase